jgi:hypothetical protein
MRTRFTNEQPNPLLHRWHTAAWVSLLLATVLLGCAAPAPSPTPQPQATATPVSQALPLTVSTYSSAISGYPAAAAIDGDVHSGWATASETVGAFLEVTLPTTHTVTALRIHFLPPRGSRMQRAELRFADGSSQEITFVDTDRWQTIALRPVATQSLRLTVLVMTRESYYSNIYVAELEIYGH